VRSGYMGGVTEVFERVRGDFGSGGGLSFVGATDVGGGGGGGGGGGIVRRIWFEGERDRSGGGGGVVSGGEDGGGEVWGGE